MSDQTETNADGGPLTEDEKGATQSALEIVHAYFEDQLPEGHRVGGVRATLNDGTPIVVVAVDIPDEGGKSGVMVPIMIVATPGMMEHVMPPSGVITEDGAF